MTHDVHARVVELFTPTSRGTGYVVGADLILTAAHVIDDDHVQVVTTGREVAGIVVWRHPVLDAALVRVAGQPWPAVRTRWAAVSGLESVNCTAIGYPKAQSDRDGEQIK